jgi:hypothetical protein
MVKSEPKVLPADDYDTLEFSALAFGGVGRGVCFSDGSILGASPTALPVCLVGHAYAVDPSPDYELRCRLGIDVYANDEAVKRINRRKGRGINTRVSWKEYTRELNIVRGDK